MVYTVPQFIEKEPKIAGPFTFKQLAFVLAAAGLAVLLYFLLPLFLFVLAAIVLGGTALALAFLRVGGISLPSVAKNFFVFLTKPKVYLWEKKTVFPKIIKTKEPPKKELEGESVLKVAQGKLLRKLSAFLETKPR